MTFSLLYRVNWMQRLNAFRVEAAWKLGRWDDLGKYLKMVQYTLHTIQSDSSPIRSCVCACVCVCTCAHACVFLCVCVGGVFMMSCNGYFA